MATKWPPIKPPAPATRILDFGCLVLIIKYHYPPALEIQAVLPPLCHTKTLLFHIPTLDIALFFFFPRLQEVCFIVHLVIELVLYSCNAERTRKTHFL